MVRGDIADGRARERLVGALGSRRALRRRVAQRQLAAQSVDRSSTPTWSARSRSSRRYAGTECAASRLDRRGVRRPRARRPGQVHAGHAIQPVEPVQLDQGRFGLAGACVGAGRSGSVRRSRTVRTTTARTSTSRSSSRARSPTCSPGGGRSCTAQARTCATGSTSTITTRRCGRSSIAASAGDTYLIGADGERSNRDVLELILELLDQPGRLVRPRQRPARPRSALCDRFDQAAHRARLAAEVPRPAPRLEQTIDWYSENRTWWQDAQGRRRGLYAETGQ